MAKKVFLVALSLAFPFLLAILIFLLLAILPRTADSVAWSICAVLNAIFICAAFTLFPYSVLSAFSE